MEKVVAITVNLADSNAPLPRDVTVCVYDGTTHRWTVTGPAFPRHLRMLSEIVQAVRTADAGVKEQ